MQDLDFVCLCETKCLTDDVMFSGFEPIVMPSKNLRHKFGGAHGMCVYVRRDYVDIVEVLNDKSEFVLWLKICSQSEPFILGMVYRKASSRGAHGHDAMIPPEALLKGIGLTPQQQTLQQHYSYYR